MSQSLELWCENFRATEPGCILPHCKVFPNFVCPPVSSSTPEGICSCRCCVAAYLCDRSCFVSRNKGDTAQSLVSCKLAGWDKAGQFRLQDRARLAASLVPVSEKNCLGENTDSSKSCSKKKTPQTLKSSLVRSEVSPGRGSAWCRVAWGRPVLTRRLPQGLCDCG